MPTSNQTHKRDESSRFQAGKQHILPEKRDKKIGKTPAIRRQFTRIFTQGCRGFSRAGYVFADRRLGGACYRDC
jgi:hypothetical protein